MRIVHPRFLTTASQKSLREYFYFQVTISHKINDVPLLLQNLGQYRLRIN